MTSAYIYPIATLVISETEHVTPFIPLCCYVMRCPCTVAMTTLHCVSCLCRCLVFWCLACNPRILLRYRRIFNSRNRHTKLELQFYSNRGEPFRTALREREREEERRKSFLLRLDRGGRASWVCMLCSVTSVWSLHRVLMYTFSSPQAFTKHLYLLYTSHQLKLRAVLARYISLWRSARPKRSSDTHLLHPPNIPRQVVDLRLKAAAKNFLTGSSR